MIRPAGLVAGGLLVFIGLVALEHVLRPGLAPTEHFVSEYARGATQPVQVAAFLAWGVATGACAVLALRAARRRAVARALTAAALGVATVGTLLCAAFVTQTVGGELPPGVERTPGGRLHDLGSLLVLAGLAFAAAASLRLVPVGGYRLLVIGLAVLLLAVVPVMVALGIDAPGVGQRAFILIGCAWQWAFARASSTRVAAPAG